MKRYSQNNEQDIILDYLTRNNLTKGKLLDIGALDGERLSNTRAIMETYAEWSGVFVDASPYSFVKLVDLYKMEPRRATLINLAIVPEDMLDGSPILEFYETHETKLPILSGVSSSVKNHAHKYGFEEVNADGDPVNPRTTYVGKVGMRELLTRFGPSFDFINIDVEGYSARLVMQDWFDLRNYGCKLLCVEHDGLYRQIQEKLLLSGYSVLGLNGENIIMAKL